MSSQMGFHCIQCGECCRHINLIPQLAAFDTGDGVCIHLHGNLCGIYAFRPAICQVELMYQKYFSDQYSCEEFYQLNERACEEIRKQYQ